MKTKIFIRMFALCAFILFIGGNVYSQVLDTSRTTIINSKRAYIFVQEMPDYPGGKDALIKYLKKNIRYPEKAKKNGITGTVIIGFIINEKGKIKDVRLVEGIGGGCNEEAMRVVKLMPKWKPGRENHKPVPVYFKIPIKFSLK